MVAFVEADDFPAAPSTLNAIAWDAEGSLGGDLFVTTSLTGGDQDTTIYRIDVAGNVSVFAEPPGPGLDSVFGMAIAPIGSALEGLYVAGDTQGAYADWGVFDAAGNGSPFSEVAGIQGITFDPTGAYGDGPIAARPDGGGFDGDDSITPLGFDGLAGAPIATGLPGVLAVTVAPPGLFAGEIVAGSWQTDDLFRVSPTGIVTTIATGLNFSSYDANVLAVSPDGRTLMVAESLRGRIVCVEEDTAR
jgi:hypothetical protein